jgi:hypothetical protein
VQAILSGSRGKEAIWNVNVDDEYHEEKASSPKEVLGAQGA